MRMTVKCEVDKGVWHRAGDQIADGEAPDRLDFQVWRDLYDEVARRDLASQMTPIAFLVNGVRVLYWRL
jgi:hypothetical protein